VSSGALVTSIRCSHFLSRKLRDRGKWQALGNTELNLLVIKKATVSRLAGLLLAFQEGLWTMEVVVTTNEYEKFKWGPNSDSVERVS
jgi:hypothetical protein